MNQNKKVLQFVLAATTCLLGFSLLIHFNKVENEQLKNIDILSSIFKKDTTTATKITADTALFEIDTTKQFSIQNDSIARQLQHFNVANRLTNFNADTNAIVLDNFIKKLIALRKNKKGKIRIAYLGDSMIEGDLVSQTLRKYLQQNYGGSGVGFVPITSAVAGFRQSIKHTFTANWKESNFKNKFSAVPLYLSGKTFFASGYNRVDVEDKTILATTKTNKYLLCGYKPNSGQIAVNSIFYAIKPTTVFNRILIDSSVKTAIKLEASDAALPFYGISFETSDGVIVDNFSFRGLGGFEFAGIDSSFLTQVNNTQPYDLIIMQYGVNLLNHPNNNSFGWYQKAMTACIRKMKSCFKNADFLLVSSADKSFKYSNGTHTAIGMDSLIATQERIAFENKIAFFNTYSSMGGYNSMINWANGNPQLAAKDYTHLNAKGAEVLGTGLFNAMMYEVNKSEKSVSH